MLSVSSNVIEIKSLKPLAIIFVTVSGMVMLFKLALSPILSKGEVNQLPISESPFPMVKDESLVHPSNADVSISFTESGIVSSVMSLQA